MKFPNVEEFKVNDHCLVDKIINQWCTDVKIDKKTGERQIYAFDPIKIKKLSFLRHWRSHPFPTSFMKLVNLKTLKVSLKDEDHQTIANFFNFLQHKDNKVDYLYISSYYSFDEDKEWKGVRDLLHTDLVIKHFKKLIIDTNWREDDGTSPMICYLLQNCTT